MASQPTIATGRRPQHEMLSSWSDRPLTAILIDSAVIAQAREAGATGGCHPDPEMGVRIAGTTAVLEFGFDGHWRTPVEVIPWTEVEAISRAVPDEAPRPLRAVLHGEV